MPTPKKFKELEIGNWELEILILTFSQNYFFFFFFELQQGIILKLKYNSNLKTPACQSQLTKVLLRLLNPILNNRKNRQRLVGNWRAGKSQN